MSFFMDMVYSYWHGSEPLQLNGIGGSFHKTVEPRKTPQIYKHQMKLQRSEQFAVGSWIHLTPP